VDDQVSQQQSIAASAAAAIARLAALRGAARRCDGAIDQFIRSCGRLEFVTPIDPPLIFALLVPRNEFSMTAPASIPAVTAHYSITFYCLYVL